MWPPVLPSVRANDNQCEMTLFSLSGSLQPTFNLMIDVHVMVNWQLSEKGICWPVAHDRATGSSFNFLRSSVACENICFSSLFATGDVSRFLRAKTSPTAKSEEKRMFSQARSFTFLRFSADQLLAFNWSQTQAKLFSAAILFLLYCETQIPSKGCFMKIPVITGAGKLIIF